MEVDNSRNSEIEARNGNEQPTLKKRAPSSPGNGGNSIQLKKPSLKGKPKLRPPDHGSLRKPSQDANSTQDDENGVAQLQDSNPSKVGIGNREIPGLKTSASTDKPISIKSSRSSLRLKKSSGTSPAVPRNAPPAVQGNLPEGVQNNARNVNDNLPKAGSVDSSNDSEESRLSVPGPILLKKQGDGDVNDTSGTASGLRLRKPSPATINEKNIDAPHTVPSHRHESDDKKQNDIETAIKLKKTKDTVDLKSKLSLSSTRQKANLDLTPPGLDVPSGVIEPTSKPKNEEETPSEKVDNKSNSFPMHSTITPPSKKVQFARKKKAELSKKQKQQIVFVWIPLLLVISGLSYMLLSKLIISEPSSEENTSRVVRPKKSHPGKSDKGSPPSPKVDQSVNQMSASQEEDGIPFPDHLLQELEQEFGRKAKEQFLEEWKGLADEERQNYLDEIGAVNKEPEE